MNEWWHEGWNTGWGPRWLHYATFVWICLFPLAVLVIYEVTK